MGTDTEFDPRIHRLRPHPGQIAAAANMDRLTAESEIISSHKDCSRVQDAYTLSLLAPDPRASKDAVAHVGRIVETELNSTTTNPLIFPESGEFILGGNFHGQPLALAADYLSMALAELANVSERRVERLVNPSSAGCPLFWWPNPGSTPG